MAYRSDDSGADEIWAQAFPAGERHRVSANGGLSPAWARNGRELFFLMPLLTSSLLPRLSPMAVDFTSGTVFKAGVPHKLFEAKIHPSSPQRSYDLTPGGEFIAAQLKERPDEIVNS